MLHKNLRCLSADEKYLLDKIFLYYANFFSDNKYQPNEVKELFEQIIKYTFLNLLNISNSCRTSLKLKLGILKTDLKARTIDSAINFHDFDVSQCIAL